MSLRQKQGLGTLLRVVLVAAGNLTTTQATDDQWESLPNGSMGQLANFEGGGGVKIGGYVRKPGGAGPFPLVIILHGGGAIAKRVAGETEEVPAEKMTAEAVRVGKMLGRATSPPILDFLAQGWAVYSIDYRSNPRYMIDPFEFDDTVIAINKARAFPFVDTRRMAIFGVKMAEIEKNPDTYHYSSLLTEVSKVQCPVLLISGKNDNNAPLPVMDSYVEKLRTLGKEAETYHPDNGPHGFYVGLPQVIPETAESTHRVVAFIKKHFESATK